MDFGFVQSRMKATTSPDEKVSETSTPGILSSQGFKAYIIIKDIFTKYRWVILTKNKSPPIKFIRHFLRRYSNPNARNKFIRTDLGGELYRSEKFREMVLNEWDYQPQGTGAYSPWQNGHAENVNRDIGNKLRTMLWGSDLPTTYWDYALIHLIFVSNCIKHTGQEKSPYELLTGHRPNLRRLRTWGCRIYAKDKDDRGNKLDFNITDGKFLGFAGTTQNYIFVDRASDRIRVSPHIRCDETHQLDDVRPPQAILLARALGHPPTDEVIPEPDADILFLSPIPSVKLSDISITVSLSDPTLGFSLEQCPHTAKLSMHLEEHGKLAQTAGEHWKRLNFTYPYEINGTYISTLATYQSALDSIKDDLASSPDHTHTVKIRTSLEYPWDTGKESDGMPSLNTDQLIHVASILYEDDFGPAQVDELSTEECIRINILQSAGGYGHDCLPDELHPVGISNDEVLYALDPTFEDHMPIDENSEIFFVDDDHARVCRIAIKEVIDDKIKITVPEGRLNRRRLFKLSDKVIWLAAETKQLDSHQRCGTIQPPQLLPPKGNLMKFQWAYRLKQDGTPKARCNLNGSPHEIRRKRLAIHKTYAACVDQVGQNLFWSLTCHENMHVHGIDVINGYQHAPPPATQTFVEIDDQYAEWYAKRFNTPVDRSLVIPLGTNLQGHPEAGAIFSKCINEELRLIPLTTTTH